jgi:two-component system response regulator YesN
VRQTERILKDEFQATFTELKQKATINRAVTLLRTTRKTIMEIAEETNFRSASYFCKMLKQQTGKTAAQVRREQTLESVEKSESRQS